MKKSNPFAGAKLVMTASGDPATELRSQRGGDRLISESGEFNAHDKKELMRNIGEAMMAMSSGRVRRDFGNLSLSAAERTARRQERLEVLARASVDPKEWQALGADTAVQIQEYREREGFLRRLAIPQNLQDGEWARVTVRSWTAQAIVATGPSHVGYQLVRPKQYQPTEFEIVANLRAENLDIRQHGEGILDDLYNQGVDAFMVREDRLWKAAADKGVGAYNKLEYITGQLGPQMLSRIGNSLRGWGYQPAKMLLAFDFWEDINGNPDWMAYFDPVTKYDLAMNGTLGFLNGMELLTDGHRNPDQRVLNNGEIYAVASPENHACYTDRGGINAVPVDGAQVGSTSRGWFMSQPFSYTYANLKSVQKAKRA